VIEPAAAAMAARNHTPQTLRAIEEAFAEMELAAHDAARFAEPDIRFHKAILTATGNDFFVAFGALTEAALGVFVRIATRHPEAPTPAVPMHGAILDAIRRRDADGAHEAMVALLDRTTRNVERNVKATGSRRSGNRPRKSVGTGKKRNEGRRSL
jgi:GntR family galactonate operon transcriptional repressor